MFLGKRADELQAMADSVPHWWHSIDFGKGVVTPGVKPQRHLEAELATLRLPSLKHKTVLDVGAWDGFFSFQMERLGASRVVALDYYVWSMDLVAKQEYWQRCQETGEEPREYHVVPGVWQPERLPGKAGFDVARAALGSEVESVIGDFMTVNPFQLGSFDVVLFKGVLYHLRHPLLALERLASVTREVAVIETSAIVVRGREDHALCEFFASDQLNADPTNWWAPNLKGLHDLCRAAGFARVETVAGPPEEAAFADTTVFRYRAVVHAHK